MKGRVTFDGKPVSGATALSVSLETGAVLDATETSGSGSYELSAPAGSTALVKIQSRDLAVTQILANGEAADITLSSQDQNRHRLTIESSAETTSSLLAIRLFVTPNHIDGIAKELEPYFLRRSARIVDDAFLTLSWAGEPLELTVQSGEYRIGGTSLSKGGPTPNGPATGIAITGISSGEDDSRLPGDSSRGFLVRVDRDTTLRIITEPSVGRQD